MWLWYLVLFVSSGSILLCLFVSAPHTCATDVIHNGASETIYPSLRVCVD